MSKRVLLTTTSFQDTPGSHQDLLNAQDWEIVRARGPLSEEEMLELAGEFDVQHLEGVDVLEILPRDALDRYFVNVHLILFDEVEEKV